MSKSMVKCAGCASLYDSSIHQACPRCVGPVQPSLLMTPTDAPTMLRGRYSGVVTSQKCDHGVRRGGYCLDCAEVGPRQPSFAANLLNAGRKKRPGGLP